MSANNCIDHVGLLDDDDLLIAALRTQIPAVPTLELGNLDWADAASGQGGVLRVRHTAQQRDLDRDLRVILLDGRTVAFWLTRDGRRLSWLQAASA
jgi:hypothetical protein